MVGIAVLAIIGVAWALASRTTEAGIAAYYPLQVGNTWSYQTKQHGKMIGGPDAPASTRLGTVEQRVVGVSRLSSDELEVFEVSQNVSQADSGDAPTPAVESILHLSATPTAVTLHAIDVKGADGSALPAPIAILTDPPSTDPLTSENGSLQMSLSVKSQEVEAVEVPAGKFPNALKKVTEGPVSGVVSGIPVRSGIIKETTWFVRDVGVVKQDRLLAYTLESQEGMELSVEETIERVLTDFSRGTDD